MNRNLQARIAKLEDASGKGELPNGGLLMLCQAEGESREDAITRALQESGYADLSASQRRKVVPVFMLPEDLNL